MPKPTRMMTTKLNMERRSDQPPGHRSSWHSCILSTHHHPLQTARRKMRPALRGRQGQLREIFLLTFSTLNMSVFRAKRHLAVLCLTEVPDQRRHVEVVEWRLYPFRVKVMDRKDFLPIDGSSIWSPDKSMTLFTGALFISSHLKS